MTKHDLAIAIYYSHGKDINYTLEDWEKKIESVLNEQREDIIKMIEGEKLPEKLNNPFYPQKGKKKIEMTANIIKNQALQTIIDRLKNLK